MSAQDAKESSISKGAYYLFVGNFVSTFVLASSSIIIGRLLGPDTYGLYTIALIIPSYGYLFLRLGLPSTLTRYTAKYVSEGDEKKAVSFSYTINLLHFVLGLLCVSVLFPFSNILSRTLFHRSELSSGLIMPIASVSVVGQILFNNGSSSFVGLGSFRRSAIVQVVRAAASLVVAVTLLLLGYSLLGAIIGYTSSFVVAGLISLFLLILLNNGFLPSNVKESVKTSIGYSPAIYLSSVLLFIIVPVQNSILAYAVTNNEIGLYVAAVNIASLIALFVYPIQTAVLPLFSKTMNRGITELSNTFRMSIKYAALLVTPVAVFVITFSRPLVISIFGEPYQLGSSYLMAFAVASLLIGVGGASADPFLYGIGETRKVLIANATGSATSILLSAALVSNRGLRHNNWNYRRKRSISFDCFVVHINNPLNKIEDLVCLENLLVFRSKCSYPLPAFVACSKPISHLGYLWHTLCPNSNPNYVLDKSTYD
ncbi:MAG: oligosaccharide flippase family protein [Nitrososphaerota archaeon]|nr:oligosaccharide flippase family protein [Nitrososphaerota archaeon]